MCFSCSTRTRNEGMFTIWLLTLPPITPIQSAIANTSTLSALGSRRQHKHREADTDISHTEISRNRKQPSVSCAPPATILVFPRITLRLQVRSASALFPQPVPLPSKSSDMQHTAPMPRKRAWTQQGDTRERGAKEYRGKKTGRWCDARVKGAMQVR
jgi:hypothetical protein